MPWGSDARKRARNVGTMVGLANVVVVASMNLGYTKACLPAKPDSDCETIPTRYCAIPWACRRRWSRNRANRGLWPDGKAGRVSSRPWKMDHIGVFGRGQNMRITTTRSGIDSESDGYT